MFTADPNLWEVVKFEMLTYKNDRIKVKLNNIKDINCGSKVKKKAKIFAKG